MFSGFCIHPSKYVTADITCNEPCRMCQNRCSTHLFQNTHESYEIEDLMILIQEQQDKFENMPTCYIKKMQLIYEAHVKKVQQVKNKYIERIKIIADEYRQNSIRHHNRFPDFREKLILLEKGNIEQLTCSDIHKIVESFNKNQLQAQLSIIFNNFRKDTGVTKTQELRNYNQEQLRQKHYKQITNELNESFMERMASFRAEYEVMKTKNQELEVKIRDITRQYNQMSVLVQIYKNQKPITNKKTGNQNKKQKNQSKQKNKSKGLLPKKVKTPKNLQTKIPKIQIQPIQQQKPISCQQVPKEHLKKPVQLLKQTIQQNQQKQLDPIQQNSEEPRLQVFEYKPTKQKIPPNQNSCPTKNYSPKLLKISRDVQLIESNEKGERNEGKFENKKMYDIVFMNTKNLLNASIVAPSETQYSLKNEWSNSKAETNGFGLKEYQKKMVIKNKLNFSDESEEEQQNFPKESKNKEKWSEQVEGPEKMSEKDSKK